MNLKDISKVEECPHCGSDFSYYQIFYVKGWITDFTLFEKDQWSGDRQKYNHNMYDSLDWSKTKDTYYCGECNKAIGTNKKSK